MHNTLQGDPREITPAEQQIFERYNVLNAGGLTGEYDYIIIHDGQPAGIRAHAQVEGDPRWIWRCHIDLSTPNQQVLDWLFPSYVADYDLSVFHTAQYIPPGDVAPNPVIMPPAIDALAPKNMALSAEDAAYIVNQFGLDIERPMILQVSRFDPWKDPLGVIDAYRLVKKVRPGVQLALVGSMATDDPEGMEYYERTLAHADGDPDIYILSNLDNVGGVEVNAFQIHADVVLQKSLKEGFGLTVTEALWKGRPTIAGNVGGIPLQIVDGETGYLVDSVEQCAERILTVFEEPAAASEMARRGKQYVRHDFLMPRLLRDWLGIFTQLA